MSEAFEVTREQLERAAGFHVFPELFLAGAHATGARVFDLCREVDCDVAESTGFLKTFRAAAQLRAARTDAELEAALRGALATPGVDAKAVEREHRLKLALLRDGPLSSQSPSQAV